MRNDLGRRIAALEQRTSEAGRIDVIIRRIVSPSPNGPVHMEPGAYINLRSGWRLDREPGEGADEFLDRARRLAPRSSPGALASLVEAL